MRMAALPAGVERPGHVLRQAAAAAAEIGAERRDAIGRRGLDADEARPRAVALDERRLARERIGHVDGLGRRDARRRRRARRGARSTTRSATPRPDQELAVAFAAEDRRGDQAERPAKPERGDEGARCRRRPRAAPPRRARRPCARCARPASNCGFTSATSAASAASSGTTGGSTSFSEMKLTSATRRSIGLGYENAVEAAGIRALRGSRPAGRRRASDGAGRCRHRPRRPCSAPRLRSTSVKPPVEAPRSRQTPPARIDARRRRAPPRASRRRARPKDAAPRPRSPPRRRT